MAGSMLVAWHGSTSVEPADGYDAAAHIAYAEVLREGRLPREAETYEYASPPAYHWLVVQLQRAVEAVGSEVRGSTPTSLDPLPRVVWLVLLAGGAALLAGARPPAFRLAGGLLVAGSAAVGLLHVTAVAVGTPWLAGQALSLLALGLLLLATWLLARAVWPAHALLPLLALAVAAALPIVVRLGTMFHPEMLFAALAAVALLAFLRGATHGWRVWHGAALGVALGLAALTRQTALVLVLSLLPLALLAGGRRAARFAAAAVVSLLLVAGPWWLEQARRYGNPIQSNLEREGYMLDRQPFSFYVSLPVGDLVAHPYRPSFENELLPKFHADLWSDWFGGQHGFWNEPTAAARSFASSQSVLGFVVSLGGPLALVLLGLPALAAIRRRLPAGAREIALATALVLGALTWVAFVLTLVRFPQAEGDPIKSSYMLFLTPLWAIVLAAAAERLWRRSGLWRAGLLGFAGLYALSYAGFLATSW